MGGADLESLLKVILDLHPAVVVADIPAPGANAEHAFEVMEAGEQAAGQPDHDEGDQKDKQSGDDAVAKIARVGSASDEEPGHVGEFIEPGEEDNESETETFIEKDLRTTFVNFHKRPTAEFSRSSGVVRVTKGTGSGELVRDKVFFANNL